VDVAVDFTPEGDDGARGSSFTLELLNGSDHDAAVYSPAIRWALSIETPKRLGPGDGAPALNIRFAFGLLVGVSERCSGLSS